MNSLLALVFMVHSGKVTFSGPAMTAPRLLAALSPIAGESLTTSSEMDNEVLLVQVKAMDSDRLMRLLADLSIGKWETAPKGRRLVRDKARLQKEEEAEFEDTGRRIQAEIPAVIRQAAPWDARSAVQKLTNVLSKPNEQTDASRLDTEASLPEHRALGRLILDAPPARMGSIRSLTEGHFASAPNAMQASLGPQTPAILASFVKEEDEYGAEMEALRGNPQLSPVADWFNHSHRMVKGAPSVTVKLKRLGLEKFWIEGGFTDASGSTNSVDHFQVALKPYALPAELRVPKLGQSNWKPTPAALEGIGRNDSGSKNDPLSIVGEGLSRVAQSVDASIVASIPDDALSPCGAMIEAQKAPTPAKFLDTMRHVMRFSVVEGVIVARPVFGGTARTAQVNRQVLSSLLDMMATKGLLAIEDLTHYFREQNTESDFHEARFNLETTEKTWPWLHCLEASQRVQRLGMLIWTSLDATTRQRMLTERGIPLSALNGDARQALANFVFENHSWYSNGNYDPLSFVDPTMAMPDGLPEGVRLTASVQLTPAAYTIRNGRILGHLLPVDVGRLAAEQAHGHEASFLPVAKTHFLPGTQRTVQIDVHLTKDLSFLMYFFDYGIDSGARPGPYTSLPEALLATIRETFEQEDRRLKYEERETHGGGESSPPPP